MLQNLKDLVHNCVRRWFISIKFLNVNILWLFFFLNLVQHILNMFLFTDLSIGESSEHDAA